MKNKNKKEPKKTNKVKKKKIETEGSEETMHNSLLFIQSNSIYFSLIQSCPHQIKSISALLYSHSYSYLHLLLNGLDLLLLYLKVADRLLCLFGRLKFHFLNG